MELSDSIESSSEVASTTSDYSRDDIFFWLFAEWDALLLQPRRVSLNHNSN